jgi:hypothetical protein
MLPDSDVCDSNALCRAQSDSESGGSGASSPRSLIVPAAAVVVSVPSSGLRCNSMLIPKLDVTEAPRESSGHPADGDSWQRSAESGNNAGLDPPSQRQGSRALSAMEGATFAIGKMQAVHRPSQVMGAFCAQECWCWRTSSSLLAKVQCRAPAAADQAADVHLIITNESFDPQRSMIRLAQWTTILSVRSGKCILTISSTLLYWSW